MTYVWRPKRVIPSTNAPISVTTSATQMIQFRVRNPPVETLMRLSGTPRTSLPCVISRAMPSAAPSDPSVVISAGTRNLVMQMPLKTPQARPAASDTTRPTTTVSALWVPGPPMAFTPQTPENTRTEPIERSKPPATITNVIPTAITISTAASIRTLRKLSTVGNAVGSRIENTTTRTSRTPPIQTGD